MPKAALYFFPYFVCSKLEPVQRAAAAAAGAEAEATLPPRGAHRHTRTGTFKASLAQPRARIHTPTLTMSFPIWAKLL